VVVRASQLEFDSRLATILDKIANRIEEGAPPEDHDFKDALEGLEKAVRTCCSEEPQRSIAIDLQTFLALSHTAQRLGHFPEKRNLGHGSLTGRGLPWARGLLCCAMTRLGDIGHTLPFLIHEFRADSGIAIVAVPVELGTTG
jgi:hypothetical protein